jgi:serine protease AprX
MDVVATERITVNAVVVYHHLPTDADLADLQQLGIVGGTRYHSLPFVTVTGTRNQIAAISRLPVVRSIYGNRTLNLTSEPEVRAATGVTRVTRDAEITAHNAGLPVSGRGVTVAVLDTGIDGTHGDLSGRVTQNVKLASLQSASVGFDYPIDIENLPDTDFAYGHGTFVAGVIGGNGAQSAQVRRVAPERLVGLSAGDPRCSTCSRARPAATRGSRTRRTRGELQPAIVFNLNDLATSPRACWLIVASTWCFQRETPDLAYTP